MKKNHEKSLAAITEWTGTIGWETEHMRQVCRLAQILFDDLKPLHNLTADDRFLLTAAALAHDVGFMTDEDRHHKESFRMIMERDIPGITPIEKTIIALVARYHRKSGPKPKHEAWSALPEKDRERVKKLAAILRIADGLDRSHNSAVESVECRISEHHVIMHLAARRDIAAEIYGARKKAGLFEEVFSRGVILEPAPSSINNKAK